jgi:hypothetical protein
MKTISLILITIIFFITGCVDRINVEVGVGATPIVVDGHISNQPGPYRIELAKAIEIDAKLSVRNLISAKKITIADNLGFTEELTQSEPGIYWTKVGGIQGEVGKAYKLRIELLDGRIYESKFDTLRQAGNLDKVYFDFKSEVVNDATHYGFDIFFDSNLGEKNDFHFLWKFIGTYQVQSNPELFTQSCGESICPKPRPCSGYIVSESGSIEQVAPCECCTCWVSLVNDLPVISDNQFVKAGKFEGIKIGYVPLDSWIFLKKVHVEVQQQSLSKAAFAFWKAVLSQKAAGSSLFQPITGKIPGNFVQIAGPIGNIEGIFYATGINSKTTYINRIDVPDQRLLTDPDLPFKDSCIKFGNATNIKPTFWE